MWDPLQYAQFSDERSRPFYDLFGRLGNLTLTRIVDLGCGSGELTRLFHKRWRGAEVVGLDSSKEMLEMAAAYADGDRLRFVQADIGQWQAQEPVDLIFTNAALQWVPDHQTLIPRLAQQLASKGVLAVQMPDNFFAPSHRVVREVAGSRAWGVPVDDLMARTYVQPLHWYIETLQSLGLEVEAWATEYQHILQGEDPVLEWIKGTALRPYLKRLEPVGQVDVFLKEVGAALRQAYPSSPYGTLFPFRRIFFIATRGAQKSGGGTGTR